MSEERLFFVNDEPRTLSGAVTLRRTLEEMGLADSRGIAVALNGAVVARSKWNEVAIAASDRVLVIRATQGG